jgi:mycothiol synthase
MVRLRSFRWADLDATAAVESASAMPGASQATDAAARFARRWEGAGIRAERDLWVAEEGGEVVGYAGLRPWHSPGWLEAVVVVHPGWRGRGVGHRLVRRLVEEARERGKACLGATAPDEPAEAGRFLRRHGFVAFAPRLHMRLRPIVLPRLEAAAGYRVRPAGVGESAVLAGVTNAAYAGNERVGRADAAGYRRYLEQSGARVWLAECACSGAAVGLCEAYGREAAIDGAARISGHIASLAVVPDHRMRGLGRRLLAEGIRYCRQAGWLTVDLNVDADNGPARRLYESAGFRPSYAYTVYQLALA